MSISGALHAELLEHALHLLRVASGRRPTQRGLRGPFGQVGRHVAARDPARAEDHQVELAGHQLETFSKIALIPCPPPMHIVSRP